MLKVAAVQILNLNSISTSDRDANLERAKKLIEENQGARIYVLPELSTCGYDNSTFDHLSLFVEDVYSGPSFQTFSKVAKGVSAYICYGIPRRLPNNGVAISHVVINDKGEVAKVYDKTHLCQFGDCSEKKYFDFAHNKELSDEHYCVFDVDGFKVGLTICYDLRFPELWRKLALTYNVDLILHPNGWSTDDSFPSWHPFVITRAIENQVYIFSVNRAGNIHGSSIICPPWVGYKVTPTVLPKEETVHIETVKKETIEEVRNGYRLRGDLLKKY